MSQTPSRYSAADNQYLSIDADPQVEAYYVDTNISASGSGRGWGDAYKTMAEAFAVVASGAVIYMRGKVREQLTTPVQVFDVSVIGVGPRPRHADATPSGGELAASTWTTPASGAAAATPLVKVIQQGWRFSNILFAGPSDAASILLFRDGGSGNDERDASHATIDLCRFASGQDGVEQSGGVRNVAIYDCTFGAVTGYALKYTLGAGIGAIADWQVKSNRFTGCANLMGAFPFSSMEFHDNVINNITTALIDTSGGNADNTFLRNAFDIAAADFDPAGGVTGKAGEVWSNYLTDAIETGLPTN